MVGKLFHSSNSELKDNSKIHFSKPKNDKNGVLKSEVFYMEEGKPKVEYQTDIFELPAGIQKSASGIKYLEMPLNQETSPFFDFMGEMDELAIGRVYQNRKKWFSEDMQLDQDTIDQYYKNLVRRGGNTTYVRLKLTSDVIIKNHYGHKLEFEKVGVNNKVQLRLLFDGLLFYQQLIIPEYVIQEIKCYDGKLELKSFQNDFPTITSEKLNSAYETDFEGLLTATKEQTTAEDLANFDERNEGFVKENLEKTDQTTAEEIVRFEEQNEAFIMHTLGDINRLNNFQNKSNEIDEMLTKTLSKANALENTENGELDDIENQIVFLLEKIKRMKESSKVSQTSQLRSNQNESEA
jgi:DNA-binding phage protein